MPRSRVSWIVITAALGVAAGSCSDDSHGPGVATSGGAANTGGTASGAGGALSGGVGSGAGGGGNTTGGRAAGGAASTGGQSGSVTGGSTATGGSDGDASTECVWQWQSWDACPVCGDDATCDGPSNEVMGDGTVASSCCGLVWQREPSPNPLTLAEAEAYCAGLTLAGAAWRLPTIAELATLVYRGKDQPTIDRVAFPDTPAAFFWSSTSNAVRSGVAVSVVDFHFGYTPTTGPTEPGVYARCVHDGGPAVTSGTGSDGCKLRTPGQCPVLPACASDANCAAPAYTPSSDGTVRSSCCDLTWQRDVVPEYRQFREALAYCAGLQLAGGGWRLPRIAELRSLVMLQQSPASPTIDRGAFPATPAQRFWSSSPDDGSMAGRAWFVDFEDGTSLSETTHQFGSAYVRCVR